MSVDLDKKLRIKMRLITLKPHNGYPPKSAQGKTS